MAHFDRGVYEPGEDVRVFDGSEDDEDVEGSRLPLLIVLALLVLAMFAGVVWLAYTQGVARGRTETPVLTAQNGPARTAPQNAGAAEPYKGFKIYEQPAPPDDDVDNTTAPAPKPAPVAATPAPVPVAPPKPVIAAAPPPPVAKPIATPAPAPKIAAATPAPAPAKPAPEPTKQAPAKPAPVVIAKAAPPPPKPAATAPPRALAPAAAPKPAAATAPVVASGAFVLQIGAYTSQSDADAAWKAYKAKHAALLADATDDVQRADLGDKGVWYRLRIAGFPSKDVASATCDRLKADGGSCFLGK